jgi:arylsulfatase A-like enzyme
VSLIAFAPGCTSREADSRPRAVIVVDVDTLRADGLSIYGNSRDTSPRLDEFARSGVRFEWAFSQAPYTLPSQVSILTSLYPWSHGVVHDDDRLGPEAATLAESFLAAGWETAAFVDGGFLKAEYGFSQGFETFEDANGGGVASLERPVIEWLRGRSRRPFFLFVHTYDVHSPYAPPPDLRRRFTESLPPPTPGFEPSSEVLESIRASHWGAEPRRLSDADIDYSRALYDAEIAGVDAWFGRLLDELDRADLLDRAVIAVISDHGEEFQEHGSVLHEKLYATVTRVPFLIRAPDGAEGAVISNVVETIDLMPTLLDLAGVAPPQGLQGRTLAATVRDGSEPEPRSAASFSPFYGEQRAITTDRARLILTLDPARPELYRYREDPPESDDLATKEPDVVEELARALRRRVTATPPRNLARELRSRTPELEAQLRALGYLR